jgi:hypothetical protein
MLQISVDHCDKRCGRRQHSFDASARQPAPSHPAYTAHASIGRADLLHRFGGTIGRIVIDKNRFPGNACKRQIKPAHQFGDIAPLFEGGDDNG